MNPDLERPYRPAFGFAFRKESFGGILYHYEGTRPDPRVTFVDSPFLVELLHLLSSSPKATPAGLIRAVAERFQLSPGEQAGVERFFNSLIQRGALIPGIPVECDPGVSGQSHV